MTAWRKLEVELFWGQWKILHMSTSIGILPASGARHQPHCPSTELLARFCFELSLLRVSSLLLPPCRFFIHSHHLDFLLQAPPVWGGEDNDIVPAPCNSFLEGFPWGPVPQGCPRSHPSLPCYSPVSFREQVFPTLLHSSDAEPRQKLGSGSGPTVCFLTSTNSTGTNN